MRLAGILAGVAGLYLLMLGTATALASYRGEWGPLIAALVVAAALGIEWLITRRSPAALVRDLGLLRANGRSIAVTLGLCTVLLLVFPVYGAITGTPMQLTDGWPFLATGIFAQAGIAEETIFRGFLFRHLRQGSSFWRAAILGAVPFTLVHLSLFLSMAPVIAATALAISLLLTFPLAWLFERAGNSIWPPALLHAVVQGAIKLVDTGEGPTMAIVWMLASAVLPWLVFLLLRPAAEQR